MNLSETAFVWTQAESSQLRWFTPKVEVDLCGHATLASAHVLWECGLLPERAPAIFETRSGTLTARRSPAGIELDFPVESVQETIAPHGLLEVLGLWKANFIGRTKTRFLVEARTEREVQELTPDLVALAVLAPGRVVVTAKSEHENADFVSRYFAPGVGIPEDPVTGSTHCALGPYWAARLGGHRFRARQLSERGGQMTVEVLGDRVNLTGQAVTVLRGELLTH